MWFFFASIKTATTGTESDIPDTLKRVGQTMVFPDESPGCIYAFNWCLNGDGVTPLRRSAFRITKSLDLKVAGLPVPKKMPLSVCQKRFINLLEIFPSNCNAPPLPPPYNV